MMKTIYIVYGYYCIGGAQKRAAILANAFINNGYQVCLVAVYGRRDKTKNERLFQEDTRIEIIDLPEYIQTKRKDYIADMLIHKSELKVKRLKQLQHLFPKSGIKKMINRSLRIERDSLPLKIFFFSRPHGYIICFGFSIFERTFYASKAFKNPIIFAETNSVDSYREFYNFADTLLVLKKADALVFQTKEQQTDLGINHDNSFVIHNPISELSYAPVINSSQREKTIVNFCALKRHKNLLLLIKSFEILLRTNSQLEDYQLLLYSDSDNYINKIENNDYRNEILDYIELHDLKNYIKLLPMKTDIHKSISNAGLFVSSSDYEGISNSMLEALAIGLPCVCTDCGGGGAREIIQDHINGLLVPVQDEPALCKAISEVIESPELAQKLSTNAIKIRDELSVNKISSQWMSVLESIGGLS